MVTGATTIFLLWSVVVSLVVEVVVDSLGVGVLVGSIGDEVVVGSLGVEGIWAFALCSLSISKRSNPSLISIGTLRSSLGGPKTESLW